MSQLLSVIDGNQSKQGRFIIKFFHKGNRAKHLNQVLQEYLPPIQCNEYIHQLDKVLSTK